MIYHQFRHNEDRKTFLRTLGEACEKTGWQVHAYCLMGNHLGFGLLASLGPLFRPRSASAPPDWACMPRLLITIHRPSLGPNPAESECAL